jgi:5-methylcytosine-specific restriction endonuclease McrA
MRRRSRLVAKTPLSRRTPLRTTREKRTGRRDTGPDRTTRELVLERDEYRCVDCGDNENLQLHHRKPRKIGGRADWRKSNSPANLLTVCRDTHDWIESRREEAYDAGLLVHEHDDPAEVPVKHFLWQQLVYLDDDGGWRPVSHVDGAR